MTIYNCTRNTGNVNAQSLGFIKEDGIWYANLPEFLEAGLGSRNNLMMVDGSDTFLDQLSGVRSTLTLHLSTAHFQGYQIRMEKIKHGLNKQLLHEAGHAPVDFGAYYRVTELNSKPYYHQLWLCPVTEYVFGNYPEEIYASIA